jgi:hypothetical protein
MFDNRVVRGNTYARGVVTSKDDEIMNTNKQSTKG